jgi:hypothetical protein
VIDPARGGEHYLWAAQAQSVDPDRIRMVGYLSPAETVDELLADAQKLIGMGFNLMAVECLNGGTRLMEGTAGHGRTC